MENHKKEPTLKSRKNMDLSRIENIPFDELFRLYVNECRIKNLAEVTIKGYRFAYKYFKNWLGTIGSIIWQIYISEPNRY